jgi:hypothetical protein
LETSTKEKRKDMINVLKIQNADTLDLEDKILQLGLKVDKIKTENDKFIKV